MYNLSVASTYGTEDMLPGRKGGNLLKSCKNTDKPPCKKQMVFSVRRMLVAVYNYLPILLMES